MEGAEKQYRDVCVSLQEQGINFDKLDDLLERKKGKLLELDRIKSDKEKLILAEKEQNQLYNRYDSIINEISELRAKFIKEVIGKDANVKFEINRRRNQSSFIQMMKDVLQKDNATINEDINKLANIYFEKNGIEKFRTLMWNIKEGNDISSCSGRMRSAIIETHAESFARIISFLPEDDLDNKLVYDLIVTRLKKSKAKRQIIVVTHNANIPVNGDAEYIVSMNSETDKINTQYEGTMDDENIRKEICDIMEGTQDAFEMRAKKYHFNIVE